MFNKILIELENGYRPNTNHLSIPSKLIRQYTKIDLNDRISKAHDAEDQKEVKCKAKKINYFRKSTSDPNIQHIKFRDKQHHKDPKSDQNQKQQQISYQKGQSSPK